MLKSFGDRVESRTTTSESVSVVRPASESQAAQKLSELEGTEFTQSDDGVLAELAVAERRVPEINASVDCQRQLIKRLASAGKDVTSEQIMLDSLIMSLFLAAEDRHRLRAMLNKKKDRPQHLRIVQAGD